VSEVTEKREKLFLLILDRLIIGLLLVVATFLATFLVNSALDRSRSKQALVTEFARVRTAKIVPVLQSQAAADTALLGIERDVAELQSRFVRLAKVDRRISDLLSTPLQAREQIRRLDTNATHLRREIATLARRIDSTSYGFNAYARAAAAEARLLRANRFWLGGKLYGELTAHYELQQEAAGAAEAVGGTPWSRPVSRGNWVGRSLRVDLEVDEEVRPDGEHSLE
jgi:hypothetical protein